LIVKGASAQIPVGGADKAICRAGLIRQGHDIVICGTEAAFIISLLQLLKK
jgi:hypothetical protein